MRRRGRHTSYIEAVEPIIKIFQKYPDISISLGLIVNGLHNGQTSYKATIQSGCVQLKCRGSRSIQTVRLYGDVQEVIDVLRLFGCSIE